MNEDNKKTSALAEVSSNKTIQEEPQIVNDYDIDAFLEKRKEFIEKVNAIMVEGSDYHVIQNKKSLGKGGAEKIASIFGWQAVFNRDEDAIGSFKLDGLIAFVCDLKKSGQEVGQGRGAATLQKNNGDPNKTIKMAQKSAFIDAVLRTSGLSDFFTQDLEDHPEHTDEVPKATEKQKKFIADLMEQKGYTIDDLAENGIVPGKTSPTEAIDFLKEAKAKILPNGTIVTATSGTPFDNAPNKGENPWEKWKKPKSETEKTADSIKY